MEKVRKTMMAVFSVAILMMPIVSIAGDLEPGGPPAPTMKTLDRIPPTWSIKLPASERFVVLADFSNGAVLDKETGLVWEKAPANTQYSWPNAFQHCYDLNFGYRKGWHLPTIEQLASLVDTSVAGLIKLPDGHPFTNVQSGVYWSVSTRGAFYTTDAWMVNFNNGSVGSYSMDFTRFAWCVRGGETNTY